MKRTISLILTLAMVLVLAVPCFAAGESDKKEEEARSVTGVTYDTTSGTGYDPVGNRFKMTGYASLSINRAVVHTEYAILNYAGGVTSGLNNTKQVVGTSASVVFSDGTTPNYHSLTGSTTSYGSAGNSFHRDQVFTGRIDSVSCRHYLDASNTTGTISTKTISGNTYTWMS